MHILIPRLGLGYTKDLKIVFILVNKRGHFTLNLTGYYFITKTLSILISKTQKLETLIANGQIILVLYTTFLIHCTIAELPLEILVYKLVYILTFYVFVVF